jgi:hypothetical protein
MVEVVCRLPVVEDFVAILNWREDGGDDVGCEENVECDERLHFWRLAAGRACPKKYRTVSRSKFK